MAKNKKVNYEEPIYESRAEQDKALTSAVQDILSAEEQAKRIIEEAEEQAKSLRAEAAAKERELREAQAVKLNAKRDELVRAAIERAAKESKARAEQADAEGAKLMQSKNKQIDKCITQLYAGIGGK